MSEGLDSHQWEDAREVAREEVRRFARIFADEIAATPARADGNLNGRDFWRALNDSIKRWEDGQTA